MTETEQALRRVADYFQQRAEVNRRFPDNFVNTVVASTFELARTRVMEEIEALRQPEDHTRDHIQQYTVRRRA